MKTIRLILLKSGNLLDIVKAKWDEHTNIAQHKKNRYYVDSKHFFYRKKKIYAFVDINKFHSMSKDEVLGQSIQPKLAKKINAKLKNELDYLTERKFWESLRAYYKKDLGLILLSLGCGAGLYAIIRAILVASGVNLP